MTGPGTRTVSSKLFFGDRMGRHSYPSYWHDRFSLPARRGYGLRRTLHSPFFDRYIDDRHIDGLKICLSSDEESA
jgi:hypothetical protein